MKPPYHVHLDRWVADSRSLLICDCSSPKFKPTVWKVIAERVCAALNAAEHDHQGFTKQEQKP